MPFTLSHAVLAPPIAKITRLPLAPLAIGCMTPDFARIISDDKNFAFFAHRWQGLIYPDLWLGLACCVLWYTLYRPTLFHFAKINAPLALHTWCLKIRFLCLIPIAILLGTATHIIWDGLTHLDFRTFAFHDILAQPIELFNKTYPLHRVLQITCSFITLPILAFFMWTYWQKNRTHYHYSAADHTWCWLLIVLPSIAGVYAFYTFARLNMGLIKSDLYFFIGKSINHFASASLTAFTLLCALFLLFYHFLQPTSS